MEAKVAAAAERKAAGNAAFGKGTQEGYALAAKEYLAATELDPSAHVLFANLAAAELEIAKSEWQKGAKTAGLARALRAATRCTEIEPTWAKGWVRRAAAEFELVAARGAWREEAARPKTNYDGDDGGDVDGDGDGGADAGGGSGADEPEASLLPGIDGAALASCEASCRTGLAATPTDSLAQQLRARLQALRDEGHATDEAADRAAADVEGSLVPKAAGNAAFGAKKYRDAAARYGEALALNPFDHVFYSNRSACYAALDEPAPALADAERCVALSPGFAKGFGRQATALFLLGRYVESEAAARAGLAVDGENAALKEALAKACVETAETAAVQAQMHTMRADKKRNDKMKAMLSGLNLGGGAGGPGFNVFSPGQMGGMGGGGLEGLLGGMGGGGGFGNQPGMTEAQMRQMARAMAGGAAAAAKAPSSAGAGGLGEGVGLGGAPAGGAGGGGGGGGGGESSGEDDDAEDGGVTVE